jgi:hypothetical protein
MYNNVIDVTAGGSARIIRAVSDEIEWTSGRQIRGSHNWIEAGSTFVPDASEWSFTLSGTDPGFTNAAGFDLVPISGGDLHDAGTNTPAGNPAFPFPNPLFPPQFQPHRVAIASGAAPARPTSAAIDIGAMELGGDAIFANGFEVP